MYDQHFEKFIRHRGASIEGVGVPSVHLWVKQFKKNSELLDLGCGTGLPISHVLWHSGMIVKGIDNSPKMCDAFKTNLPEVEIACEDLLDSNFFNRSFDGIIGWGIIFLFNPKEQERILHKVARHLKPKGKFLFTAPIEKCSWKDILTSQKLESLGKEKYIEIGNNCHLKLENQFLDTGNNNYYSFVKES
jgi:cyclopropane fatty-acyl-phospholipid synthase-like methyltransferase